MRKLILPLLLILTFWGCNENRGNQYTINGTTNIDSLNGKWVYIVESLNNTSNVIDSAQIADNKFLIKEVTLVSPYKALMLITFEDKQPIAPLMGSYIVIEPGNIHIDIDEQGIVITGTPLNDLIYECENAIADYTVACEEINNKPIAPNEKRTLLESARTVRNTKMLNVIIQNIDNDIALSILREKYMYFMPEQLDDIIASIRLGRIYEEEMQLYKAARATAMSTQFTDIQMNDVNGNSVKLSDYVGKHDYVLIDFWASWCGPCRRAMPELQAIYDKEPREHFEIIGISLDDNKNKWKAAIKDIGLNWINISSLDAWDCSSVKNYGISFIPSTVVIDRNGTIVGRNIDMNALEILLEE